ncbi:S9 family peptidase [Alkalihalobacillus sp. AL-G]|uniref:S9 family peptidase n=1 Tax=Alkalihalobacillus sp. AL-G TaxID=2926399 RepID=UPI00272AB32C|nr:S9 family peptidase [Alkalihalobacillus sp. AL-G]WLD94789.1 S9 family peptidase [Alkalihalobacillus sp. AL-G]
MKDDSGVKVDDLYRFKFVSDPQVSPDGSQLAYVVKEINENQDYQSNLYLFETSTRKIVKWTSGDSIDFFPRWSPDGQSLLFLSNRSGDNQVWTISAKGGEPDQLTSVKGGALQPSWSADGTCILYTFTDSISEQECNGKKKPIEIDQLRYKADGKSTFTQNSYQQIAKINLDDRIVQPLTDLKADHFHPKSTPDGKGFVFACFEEDVPGLYRHSKIILKGFDDEEVVISDPKGTYSHPTCSPDGRFIAYIGHKQQFKGATYNEIWVYDRENETTRCLTKQLDIQVGDVMISDLHAVEPSPHLTWNANSETLYFLASEFGNTELYEIDLYGNVDKIVEGDRHIYQYAMDDDARRVYLAVSTPTHPGELVLHEINNLNEEPVTAHNNTFLNNITLSVPEPVQFPSQDGTVIHGWLLKPIGFQREHSYPLVLEVHGGPHMMYGNTFFHEFQVLSNAGYGVLYLNPRGSHGYGQAFVNGCRGDYGGGDYQDLMAGIDHALESYEWIDQEQLYVTGGSYGGFMTNWIVGSTNRFRAAVTQRSICNWHSFYGVSDIGYFFTEGEIGAHMENDPEKLWYHSPLRLVKNVETPLLILHGEKDYRCPIEQAEQLFIALKQQNKPVRLVRFPDADHNLSRNGDPAMRVERLKQIVGWFEHYRSIDTKRVSVDVSAQ